MSLALAVSPAASKASDIRAEAAKTLLDWKSSRAVSDAAKTPAPESPSLNNPSSNLDAFFDGSLPSSREVLSRAESRSLHPSTLARALSDSKSPSDSAARLSALGVLSSKEAALAAPDEAVFRFLLTRIWRKTAQSLSPDFQIDASFGIPALKVERDGTTYFVHAVAHGQFGAPRRGAVLSLVRRVQAADHALYSEQNLPAYYGYKSGSETLDHAASALPSVVPAAPGYSRETLLLKRAIDWAVAPGSALAALGWALAVPASTVAWVLLPILGILAWLVLTGGLPLMRWKRRRLAAGARAEGLEDIAEQYADEAANFFVAKPDLEVLRGLELPQPLGATDDILSLRSRAIADAVANDVAASGTVTAHLVVGHLHAHEVAWRLANGPIRPIRWSDDARSLMGSLDRFTRASVRGDFAAAAAKNLLVDSTEVKGSDLRATMVSDTRYAVVWERDSTGAVIVRAVVATQNPGTIENIRALVYAESGGRIII